MPHTSSDDAYLPVHLKRIYVIKDYLSKDNTTRLRYAMIYAAGYKRKEPEE